MSEYDWYEWVKFRDIYVYFPESKIQLGRHVGASIDIGPSMVRKVLNVKGKMMYHTSMISLTYD
jgi:hypothetical protein